MQEDKKRNTTLRRIIFFMALFIGTFIGNQQMAGMGLIEVVREAQKMKDLAFFGKTFIYVMIPVILHFSFREEVGGI